MTVSPVAEGGCDSALSALGAALVLSLGATALAATATKVVGPNGKVAGQSYSRWLPRYWQTVFSAPAPGPTACGTVTVRGQRVALLTVGAGAPGVHHYTCTVPAGGLMFVSEPSNECSTEKGDHGTFGTPPAQLKRCARAMFQGAAATT